MFVCIFIKEWMWTTPIFEFVTEERGRDGWRCAKSRSCSSGVTTMEDETSSRRHSNHGEDSAAGPSQHMYLWSQVRERVLNTADAGDSEKKKRQKSQPTIEANRAIEEQERVQK